MHKYVFEVSLLEAPTRSKKIYHLQRGYLLNGYIHIYTHICLHLGVTFFLSIVVKNIKASLEMNVRYMLVIK